MKMINLLKTPHFAALLSILLSQLHITGALSDQGHPRSSHSPGRITVNQGFYNNSDGSPLLRLIDSASHSIDIEVYTMQDPAVRASLRGALKNKVRVRVVQEASPVGAACKIFSTGAGTAECADLRALVKEVKAKGGQYVPFNKSNLCGIPGKPCFQHGKLVIVDSQTALLSTGNFDATNLCDQAAHPSRCNRDYSYVTLNSQLVTALRSIFEHDLVGKSYDLRQFIPSPLATQLTVSPFSLVPLVNFIASAKTSIEIENQYLKELTINAALIKAAKKGLNVRVTVSSVCAFGKPTSTRAAQWASDNRKFEAAGIHIRIFDKKIQVNGHPGYLHAKGIVVDGKRGWLGSVNGSTTSTSSNREFGIFFNDPTSVRTLEGILHSDETNPDGETWQQSLSCAKG